MRGGAGFIVVVLALAGCRNTDKAGDREPIGTAAGRSRAKDGKDTKGGTGQTWLDPTAKLPGAGTGVPKSGPYATDPRSPGFDAKAEAQDVVGGKVVDAFNRPAKNIFIQVDAVNAPPGAGELGIYTDAGGYFLARGLKPGKAYNLTAKASQDGKQLSGSVQTLVPNPVLTIVLREDAGLPPAVPGGPTGGGTGAGEPFPPVPSESDRLPPMGLAPAAPTNPKPPGDGAWSPGAGANRPVPATIGGSPNRPPAPASGGGIPQPDDLTAPPKPARPENVADGPKSPSWPPPVNIPGPPTLPTYPLPPPPGPAPDPKRPVAPRAEAKNRFTLVDGQERPWGFPADRSGSLVLLEFVSTNCVHCKTAAPVLADLQSRYGASGLQVIAVLCDNGTQKQRAAAAAKYGEAQRLNFPVYAEAGPTAGRVRDKFGVEGYPTAVLLDPSGSVVWNGHPAAKRKELEEAVRTWMGK